MNKYFAPLNQKSLYVSKYFNLQNPDNFVWGNVIGWQGTLLSEEVYLKEPVLNIINDMFPIQRAGFLHMKKNTLYEIHRDDSRGATINMLLQGSNSKSLFCERTDYSKFQHHFIEIPYQTYTFFLFNTQQPHSVINFESDRFIFTVEFKQPKESLSYKTLHDWCKQKNLIDETV